MSGVAWFNPVSALPMPNRVGCVSIGSPLPRVTPLRMSQRRTPHAVPTDAASGGRVVALSAVLDEAALLEGLRGGKPQAQAAFFRRYHAYVERLVTRVLGFDAEVPDLVQEVFFAALKGIDSFRGDHGALSSWLGQIAIRTARGCIRRRKALKWLDFRPGFNLDDVPGFTPQPEERQALARAYLALDKLPTDERLVFSLRAIEGMDVAEVCSLCEISPATVKRKSKSAQERFFRIANRDPVLRDWLASRSATLDTAPGGEDEEERE